MTKPNFTEIVVVLDRSGSMDLIKKDMEGGYDNFMREQRLTPGECKVSLYQFDTEYEVVYESVPINDVKPLMLIPRGWTALYDAVANTIVRTGERYSKLPEHERPSKVLFMVITDGEENRSVEYSISKNGAQRVKSLIEHQTKNYQWAFVYLGSTMNTQEDASKIGIAVAANFVPTSRGVENMFSAVNDAASKYRLSSDTKSRMSLPKNIGEEDKTP